jgi:hypothetical protein
MMAPGVGFLHDSVRPHKAAGTRALLEHFNWELFDHPPNCLILLPATTTRLMSRVCGLQS